MPCAAHSQLQMSDCPQKYKEEKIKPSKARGCFTYRQVEHQKNLRFVKTVNLRVIYYALSK
jgi:hypothetical protein